MSLEREVKRQLDLITDGTMEIIPIMELKEKLTKSISSNKPLRIKMGIDPTSPDIHIGHMTVYKKVRQLQDLGHSAHLIIGDYTARIGDSTGRNCERPPLSEEEVINNSNTYKEQIFKIVDENRTKIHFQSSWFNNINLADILSATSKFSVAHMLSHETFKKRLDTGTRLSLHEMLYPVLQAWDSIMVESDIELGGMDQKFNILCGRDMQRDSNMEPQVAIFMPLLMGTDGRKMSKSFGNHIPVLSTPNDKFGKVMSIKDDLIIQYFSQCTTLNRDEIEVMQKRLQAQNPRDIKLELAEKITSIYHNNREAELCKNEFLSVFSNKKTPTDIPEISLKQGKYILTNILKSEGIIPSISEGKRLIKQGATKINGDTISDTEHNIQITHGEELVIKVGKRRFLKIKPFY